LKIRDLLKAAIFILAVAALVVWLDDESWEPLSSAVRVVDGDSLAVGRQRLRLLGIDAPELEQTCLRAGKAVPCGRLARDHLAQLIGKGALACSDRGLDKHGRTLAVCRWQSTQEPDNGALVSAGSQATINAQMVHDGWAVSYGDYKALEVLAALAGRGLWELEFEVPQDWRRENGIGQ
tara:strand:- start:3652 stop:4188 length:537 start_codon:yes stop_codon:yes gene_type:complete